jgi:hypothetical protein
MFGFSQNNTGLGDAARHAVDPTASITKLQFQPNYYIYHGGGNQFNLTSRVIHPFNGIFLPFFKPKDPKKFYSVTRIEVPVTSQTYPGEPASDATGLADITCLDMLVVRTGWGCFGGGPAFGFPTATSPVLGSGKWTAGVCGIIKSKMMKGWMLGVIVQQLFSYAGSPSKPPVNYMQIQPMINFILGKGYFLGYTPIITIDWEKKSCTLPLSVGFGKALAKNFTIMLTPEYFITGPVKKSFLIELNTNAMF